MTVENFPHDEHELSIQLGILAQRQPGGRWDKNKWKIALASESDSQESIRIPHGLLVDNIRVPGFSYDKDRGLDFQLVPLSIGKRNSDMHSQDFKLEVKLKVKRESGYYDNNIMPLLCTINIVAVSVLCLDASQFFNRGLMMLNMAFVEVGIRMSLDSRLPSVGYQIKMQRILNIFFFSLLFMTIESSIMYTLTKYTGLSFFHIRILDLIVAVAMLGNTVYLTHQYYKDV